MTLSGYLNTVLCVTSTENVFHVLNHSVARFALLPAMLPCFQFEFSL
jgi:hypothetical protein